MKRKQNKRRFSVSTMLLVVILLAGIGVMLYPSVSDWWNSMHATRAIANYVEAVDSMSEQAKEEIIEAARQYNKSLANGANFNVSDEKYAEYEKILDISGTGIMGYIQIPSINVNLPVYHGTEETVLQIAVGHIAGSSFPVGGKRTHCILSGHRGLPSAVLFTDLDKMKKGDHFLLHVLDDTLCYQVDKITVVEPDDTEALMADQDQDLATLLTCTPYGVNSHRLLVRGRRIPYEEVGDEMVAASAFTGPSLHTNYLLWVIVGLLTTGAFILLLYVFDRRQKRSGRNSKEESS